MSGRLITYGEALVAILPRSAVSFELAIGLDAYVGGAELNACVSAQRLGASCILLTRLGDDGPGRLVDRRLREEGISQDYVETDLDRPTGLYLREWLPDGARRVTYYRRGSAASAEAPACLGLLRVTADDIVLLTGVTLALGDEPRRACFELADAGRAASSLVAFDPNYRPAMWDSEREARAHLSRMVAMADLLLLSEDDAALLYDSVDPDVVLARAPHAGPRAVVFKRGSRGAEVLAADGERFIEPPAETAEAVDPVGAGDGFNGGLVAALLAGCSLREATRIGAFVGARAVEAVGDNQGFPRCQNLPPDLSKRLSSGQAAAEHRANEWSLC